MQPLLSIIIPVFNRAHCIEETLRSVQNQEYAHWECIVIDDGSTDASMEKVAAFAKADSRIQLFKRPETLLKGANTCRNYGFEKSKGLYVNWLDSDDLISPDKLKNQVQRLQESTETYQIATSKWNKFVDTVDAVLPRTNHLNKDFDSGLALIEAFDHRAPFFPCHSYLVSRAIIASSGLWNESLKINQDGEFFTRVLIHAKRVVHAPIGMAYYRTPEAGSVSQLDSVIKAEAAVQSWKLIASHLKQIEPQKKYAYVENAKTYLFQKIKDQSVIHTHASFFKGPLDTQKKEASLQNKIIKKVKRLFFKL